MCWPKCVCVLCSVCVRYINQKVYVMIFRWKVRFIWIWTENYNALFKFLNSVIWFNHDYERIINFILYFVGNMGNIEKIKLSINLPPKENSFQSFFGIILFSHFFLFKYASYNWLFRMRIIVDILFFTLIDKEHFFSIML